MQHPQFVIASNLFILNMHSVFCVTLLVYLTTYLVFLFY